MVGGCGIASVATACLDWWVGAAAAGVASGMVWHTLFVQCLFVGGSYDAVTTIAVDVAGSRVELGICVTVNVRNTHVVNYRVLAAAFGV